MPQMNARTGPQGCYSSWEATVEKEKEVLETKHTSTTTSQREYYDIHIIVILRLSCMTSSDMVDFVDDDQI